MSKWVLSSFIIYIYSTNRSHTKIEEQLKKYIPMYGYLNTTQNNKQVFFSYNIYKSEMYNGQRKLNNRT